MNDPLVHKTDPSVETFGKMNLRCERGQGLIPLAASQGEGFTLKRDAQRADSLGFAGFGAQTLRNRQ